MLYNIVVQFDSLYIFKHILEIISNTPIIIVLYIFTGFIIITLLKSCLFQNKKINNNGMLNRLINHYYKARYDNYFTRIIILCIELGSNFYFLKVNQKSPSSRDQSKTIKGLTRPV